VIAAVAVIRYQFAESLRRRVFLVVFVLTIAFLALYALGAHFAFRDITGFAGGDPDIVDPSAFVGATVFGLAMFAILFLGAVLAVFLTIGVVRGDAESGLLQPLVVRPLGRGTMLFARFAGAAIAASAYVLAVYAAAVVITHLAGGWSPDHLLLPVAGLALGVTVVAAISVLASTVMASTAQGIAVFMVFGAGLTAGLLGQIGRGLGSGSLDSISDVATWALPFEALYQAGLHGLISETSGLTGVVLQLGPFGGSASAGPGLVAWSLLYTAAVVGAAVLVFSRQDL
jgi:ABC-type transport system involved in multi-copper enzyme maturation permease subunit